MIRKRTTGHAELIRKYRRYICEAAASAANSADNAMAQADSRQKALTSDRYHLGSRLGARLTRS